MEALDRKVHKLFVLQLQHLHPLLGFVDDLLAVKRKGKRANTCCGWVEDATRQRESLWKKRKTVPGGDQTGRAREWQPRRSRDTEQAQKQSVGRVKDPKGVDQSKCLPQCVGRQHEIAAAGSVEVWLQEAHNEGVHQVEHVVLRGMNMHMPVDRKKTQQQRTDGDLVVESMTPDGGIVLLESVLQPRGDAFLEVRAGLPVLEGHPAHGESSDFTLHRSSSQQGVVEVHPRSKLCAAESFFFLKQ